MKKEVSQLNKELAEKLITSEYSDKTLVFGEGSKRAKVFMIGEAPGGDEEKQGRPFVGKAGKNLNEFLERVCISREEIYISNVVKLRPISLSPKTQKPVNRTPNKSEIEFFLPFLNEEISIIEPDIIVTLGNVPLKAVSGDNSIIIGDVHGTLLEINGRKIFPLYHPAAIIYNRDLKDTYYDDLEKIKHVLFV